MMLRHQHHTIQNQLRDQNRIANSTRQMSQSNMIPAHQAHMHLHRGIHGPQQIISMSHQPMHHMQNSGPRQPMMITQNPQNPNGTMLNVGLNRQGDGSQTVIQYQQQVPPQQHQQQQQIQNQNHQPSKTLNESPINLNKRQLRDQSPSNKNHGNSTNINNIDLTNMKEKTPMCLVNELARFNKIQHQYRLTNEQGPAHKKRFTVTLKLGEEEYVADGASIKKAQHSAATEALSKTWYRQPPPKPRGMRINSSGKSSTTSGNYTSHLPPTVELNALAMKRGESTIYTFKQAPSNQQLFIPQNFGNLPNHQRSFTPNYQQVRSMNSYPKNDGLYLVTLTVGEREFIGKGVTAQAARHDAASRALEQLRQLPLPEDTTTTTSTTTTTTTTATTCVSAENGSSTCSSGIDEQNSELKSPVSLVHETALKRGLSVSFEVVSETGKPHIRTFSTKCIVGDTITIGEGSSKKVSKKKSAELMLEKVKKLPPVTITVQNKTIRLKRKPPATKKKSRNLIKDYQEPKSIADTSDSVNPISRLVQIQQSKREKEPIYTLLEEKGAPRKREFLMEVSIGQYSATGIGPNKKMGKRAAAEALLTQLGYSKPQIQPTKPAIKTKTTDNDNSTNTSGESKPRKVTFLNDEKTSEESQSQSHGGSLGRQLVPGLLLVDGGQDSKISSGPSVQAVAEELREQQQTSPPGISPKEQLTYLAQLLNFQVEFSDFPKGVHKEFLSLVSLNTHPPQVCHGHGPTTSASRDQAARTALRTLSKLGLDSVTSTQNNKQEKNDASDAIHINTQTKTNMLNQAIDK
ncbi:hypothetical protein HCN44_005994 [Aphidius gifuensis]|uniref:DRBM domain-containing protein n=1 Tax=Aphidius gifuensis TaxID=684658 RepID=A0A834Y1E2_APHGI|nr:double-stranded RNA-binding protein Staufen homolog 2 [Aphidius gifuensis]XP_044005858.1 double-stranded RNA-binding protein Staufen homolog 2 [Aphidius gifuensis]KAF7997423.1 hypothetical protein HCN44_005994 [Aphidius gifuensis]